MKTKIIKKYTYEGLGFPIELTNVEMVYISGEYHAKIDVRTIAEQVMRLLPFQEERLTGSQIKFIRSYFAMSLRKFAKEVVKESHMAVAKWEKFGHHPTNMDVNTEIMLRLYIFETICVKTAKEKKLFFDNYQLIKDTPLLRKLPKISLMAA